MTPKAQDILQENIGDDYETFFDFFTRELIFPSVILEVNKIYELDKLMMRNPSRT